MAYRNTRLNGFTLVELLIVIVVIGILAAITLVAYNGIQQKAANAKTVSAVSDLKKVLMAYAAETGTYPSSSACVGTSYPDSNSDGQGECEYASGSIVLQTTAQMNSVLSGLGAGNINPDTTLYANGGGATQGGIGYIVSSTFTLDSQKEPYWLFYFVKGSNLKCADYVGGLAENPYPNFSSTPPNGWNGASEAWQGGTKCYIPLPSPT